MGKLTIKDGKLVEVKEAKRQEEQVLPVNAEIMEELDDNVYMNQPLQQEQQYQQPEVPPQRFVQRPSVQQQSLEEEFNAFKISIELINGTVVETQIPPEKEALDRILGAIVESIDNQSTVAIGNHFFNGRNIVGFSYTKV